jgi:hypothetical protein
LHRSFMNGSFARALPPPKRPPSKRVKEVMSTYSEAEAAKRLEAEALELAELEAQRRKRAR